MLSGLRDTPFGFSPFDLLSRMTFSGIARRLLEVFSGRRRPPVSWPAARTEAPTSSRAEPSPTMDPHAEAVRAAEEHRVQAARANRLVRVQQSAPAVEAFVASVRHLPLFSGTAMQLMRSVGRENVTAGELVRLISTDAGLVAHLLRIVNSPYYGLASRLATVGDALSVLGFDRVRRIITAAVLQRPLMTYLHDNDVVRAFWRHELTCAALARHLAMRRGLDGEIAYMAGLMHDIGRLALLMQYPEHTDLLLRVRGEADDDHFDMDRELEQFGFDHAQVGGALLKLWGLPAPIVQAANDHVDETVPASPMSAAVWHANLLSYRMVDDTEQVEEPWMVEIGLTVRMRREILDEIAALASDPG